ELFADPVWQTRRREVERATRRQHPPGAPRRQREDEREPNESSQEAALDEGEVGLETARVLTDGFEMELTSLELRRDGVDVAEPALECAALEDGRRAGGMIDGVGDLLRLVDGERRREPDQHALFDGEVAHAPDAPPDLLQGGEQQAAGRAQLRFALRDLRLDHPVLAKLAPPRARGLVPREIDELVHHRASDAERDAGETRGVEAHAREAVQRSGVATLGGIVSRDRRLVRDEELARRVRVAAGGTEADDVPGVLDRHARRG